MARIPGTANGERLDGFPEDDRILGFGGNDSLFGYQGDDVLIGHGGNDDLQGGPGRDRLKGGGGNDLLFGDEDNDILLGQGGQDELQGGSGEDRLNGGGGRDLLFGDEGDDILRGGRGIDELQGGPGNDRLEGGQGFDRLFGEAGNDTLVGGAGEDRFVVESITEGLDDILDFDMDNYDRLLVSTGLSGFESGADFIGDFVRVEQSGNDTLVLINPDGAGSDFTPVLRLVNQVIDPDNLTTYGMTYKPIDPDELPLRSNPALSSDEVDASGNPAVSADGRLVAFESVSVFGQPSDIDFEYTSDIFIKDFATGVIIRITTEAEAFDPTLSSDGRAVAFESSADLVAGDVNGHSDIFVKNVLSGDVILASSSSSGAGGSGSSSNASISGDGRLVAFESGAPDLVAADPNSSGSGIFVKDLSTGEIERISAPDGGLGRSPMLSDDGSALVFETFQVVPGASGPEEVTLNVVFTDLASGRSTNIAPASSSDSGAAPDVSADGQFVAFASDAGLVSQDTNQQPDIYIYDRTTGTFDLVSANSAGQVASGPDTVPLSSNPSISDDGRFVAFASEADNLVVGDTNGLSDIFVKDTLTGLINRVSLNADGSGITDESSISGDAVEPAISGDGRSVTFSSAARSLQPDAPDDDHPASTVFLTATGFGAVGAGALDTVMTPAEPAIG